MPFLILRLTVLLIIGGAAALGALRLPPLDARALQPFLPPAGCPAPCWLGIRPGETPLAEAQALLAASPWVKQIIHIQPIDDINTLFLMWDWSGRQPPGLHGEARGELRVVRRRSAGLRLRTNERLGDLWLLLGGTRLGTGVRAGRWSASEVSYTAVFEAAGLLLRYTVASGASPDEYWSTLVEVEIANPGALAYFAGYTLPRHCALRCG